MNRQADAMKNRARRTLPPLAAGTTRRSVLGLAAAGVAGLVAACRGGQRSAPAASQDGTTGSASSSSSPTGATGAVLVRTADVPVGGGVILGDAKVVVTQPTAGRFKAFSSTCTHQDCQVSSVAARIGCMCHGSSFSIVDGSPAGGPARSPLPEIGVSVEGDSVVRS